MNFLFKKGHISIEVIFSIILCAGLVFALVHVQTQGKKIAEEIQSEGLFQNTSVVQEVLEQNNKQANILDWGIILILSVISIGSILFIGKSDDNKIIAAIIIILMIVLTFVAGLISNFWEESVAEEPSIATEFPKTNWFFNNYVSTMITIMLLQLFIVIITNRSSGI